MNLEERFTRIFRFCKEGATIETCVEMMQDAFSEHIRNQKYEVHEVYTDPGKIDRPYKRKDWAKHKCKTKLHHHAIKD